MNREPRQADKQHDVQDFPETGGQSVVKQKREVFGPALDHCGGCSVHAGTQGIRRIAKAKTHLAALGEEREFHVLEDPVSHCGVAAEAAIGFALDEQKLAVGGGYALVGVGDLGRRIGQGEFGKNQRHERSLGKASDELARRVAQHPGFVTGGFVDGAVQIARLVDGVRVGEQEPAAARFAGRGPDGVVLPCPAFLEFGG